MNKEYLKNLRTVAYQIEARVISESSVISERRNGILPSILEPKTQDIDESTRGLSQDDIIYRL